MSFLNYYSKSIYCKIVEDDKRYYKLMGSDIEVNCVVKENKNNITYFYYIDGSGGKSKPLMLIANKNTIFKKTHNFINDNLSNYSIFYKKVDDNIFHIKIT